MKKLISNGHSIQNNIIYNHTKQYTAAIRRSYIAPCFLLPSLHSPPCCLPPPSHLNQLSSYNSRPSSRDARFLSTTAVQYNDNKNTFGKEGTTAATHTS